MTTATAPTRAIIEDRWRMATTETVLDNSGPAIPSDSNSKAMRRLMSSLEMLAGRMVEDGIHEETEEQGWDALQFDLLTTIEQKIMAYALELETARFARQNGTSA